MTQVKYHAIGDDEALKVFTEEILSENYQHYFEWKEIVGYAKNSSQSFTCLCNKLEEELDNLLNLLWTNFEKGEKISEPMQSFLVRHCADRIIKNCLSPLLMTPKTQAHSN